MSVGLFEETHDSPVQYKLLPPEERRNQCIKRNNGQCKGCTKRHCRARQHDNTKTLMDVPKFYGNTKDTLTAREFIKRLEQAAAIGTWNYNRKCAEFCHLLHSEAKGFMTMTLEKAKIAENDWAGHKKVFLKFYDIKVTARLNFFSLHEMKQGPTEKVGDFWTKVQLHMDRIKDLVNVHEQVDALDKADFAADIVGDVRKERQSAAAIMQDFYEKQIFIAGLNADI